MENEVFQTKVLEFMSNITGKINSMDERLSSLEQGQERIEKKLNAVYEQTAMLTEFRTEVNKKTDSLETTQNRQEIILGQLSLRSIEQEADIAYLRKAL